MTMVLPLVLSAAVAASSPSEYVQLEVGSVRVSTKRPGSDEPWTTVKEGGTGGCGLLSLVPGVPAAATTLCGAVQSSGGQAHSASAPDIFVKVSAGAVAYRSYVVRRSFSHKFNFRVLVPAKAIPRSGLVVELMADDGKGSDETKETVGSFRYPLAALVDAAKEGKILGGSDGGIEKFELMVEAADGAPINGRFRFDAAKGMQIVEGVEVAAGQVVEVSASGSYRMPGQTTPVGPNGVVAVGQMNYPDEPFKSGRHGAALVRVGRGGAMTSALVYSCASVLAPFSGPLVVGVNRPSTNGLSGSLAFDYTVRPATAEEWQSGKVPSCSAAADSEAGEWSSRAAATATRLIRSRPTMAVELLKLTHPTGRNPAITSVKRSDSQGPTAVEIELGWEGGLTRTRYTTRITWEFAREGHIQTTVSDDGGVAFHVDAEHKRRVDAFFRDQMFPNLSR